jgi:hypothetical protein
MSAKEKEKKKHEIIMNIDVIAHKLRTEVNKLEPIQVNKLAKDIEKLVEEYRELDDYEKYLEEAR